MQLRTECLILQELAMVLKTEPIAKPLSDLIEIMHSIRHTDEGFIAIKSEVDKESVFTVHIPYKEKTI